MMAEKYTYMHDPNDATHNILKDGGMWSLANCKESGLELCAKLNSLTAELDAAKLKKG